MDFVVEVAVYDSGTYQQNIFFLFGLDYLVVGRFGGSLIGERSHDHFQRHINVRVAASARIDLFVRIIRLVDLVRSLRDLRQRTCFGLFVHALSLPG